VKQPLLIAFYVGPLLAWMTFIFFLSTGAGSTENSVGLITRVLGYFSPRLLASLSDYQLYRLDYAVRKLGHLTEYFILTLLAVRAIQFGHPRLKKSAFFGALTLSVLYAISDEFHQRFVGGRSASSKDVLIDIAGIVLCIVFILVWFAVKHLERRLLAMKDRRNERMKG